MAEEVQYKLGCRKDRVDKRDWKITRMTVAQVADLPPSFDYTDKMSPVGNQLSEGTCVGFASVDGMKEYQENEEWKEYKDLSVRYVYDNCKKIDGYPNEEGTEVRLAMKILCEKGVCYESCWPYIPGIPGEPCPDADDQAKGFIGDGYWRVDGPDIIQAMKETLVANGPIVPGVIVFNGIFNAPGGVVPMPAEGEKWVGGHAICVVGYDDAKKWFKFKNSWGKTWGDGGYGYMSYDYMAEYLMDVWCAHDKLGGDKPTPPKWYDWIVNFFRVLFSWFKGKKA